MRADSPGHCAKYGSYSMMDLEANRIIDIQLVQVILHFFTLNSMEYFSIIFFFLIICTVVNNYKYLNTAVEVEFIFSTKFNNFQSTEVGGSPHMEKEGLVRSLEALEKSGLHVGVLVTDRHPQVQKYMRQQKPNITHYYDVWHCAKGIYCTVLKFIRYPLPL